MSQDRTITDDAGALSATVEAPGADDAEAGALGELSGKVIGGRYELSDELGRGGMGAVYRARDVTLEREVAVKLLHGHRDDQARSRFLREARAMARLSDDNLVTIFDAGDVGGVEYLAMELIEGQTLRQWLGGEHDWRAIVERFVAAGSGLAAAHDAGLVHRDFKPDNVLIGAGGRPQVTDFGLAREAEAKSEAGSTTPSAGDPALTATGAIMGTPAYMSPEQHEGAPADARSDQFSFAVALYEALYGELPFAGKSLAALSESVTAGERKEPPADTEVPDAVRAVLARSLQVRRDDRYPSMGAMLIDLRHASSSPRSRRWLAMVAVLAAGGAVALGVAARKGDAPAGPLPKVRIGIARQSGGTSEDAAKVKAVVREHLDDIKACYATAWGGDPPVAGAVHIAFEIARSGSLSAFRVTRDDFEGRGIGACVGSKSMRWTFPPNASAEPITITYPFQFLPAD